MTPLLLLTGPPGIGKTTALLRTCERLSIRPLRGFYTEEVRERGVRRGFRLVTFDGESSLIADVRRPGPPRVGKYGVDVAAIDAMARQVLAPDPAVRLFVIDEIGKMECLSHEFVRGVRMLLSGRHALLATVALKGEGLIDEVKREPRAHLTCLTHANRDRVPAEIADALHRWQAQCPRGRPESDAR